VVYKKKRKENEKNEGDIILVLAGKYSEIGEEGGRGARSRSGRGKYMKYAPER